MGGVDLAPTILDYFGIPVPIEFQGESVLPLVIGASALQRFQLSLQPCMTSGGIFSFRSTRHKLIVNPSDCQAQDPEGYSYAPGGELYDLLADPQETQNLYEREPELVLFLKRHLAEYRLKNDLIPGSNRTLNSSFNTVQEMTGNVP
jgi:arylsulfatase A-like enzyme